MHRPRLCHCVRYISLRVQDAEIEASLRDALQCCAWATRPRELPSVNALMSSVLLDTMRGATVPDAGSGARPMQHDAHAGVLRLCLKLPACILRLWFQTCCLYVGYMKVLSGQCATLENPLSSSVTDRRQTDGDHSYCRCHPIAHGPKSRRLMRIQNSYAKSVLSFVSSSSCNASPAEVLTACIIVYRWIFVPDDH
jgi:hypothetical protein